MPINSPLAKGKKVAVQNSEWKACTVRRVVRLQSHGQWERLILLQHRVFMLVWPEEFLHITHTVISEEKGKTLKQSQHW